MNTTAEFLPEYYYHVYNRTNNGEALFKELENRKFYLDKFDHYLRPFCIVHSYALMKNHFHYSIRIKSLKEIVDYIKALPKGQVSNKMNGLIDNLDDEAINHTALNKLVIGQFQNFFNSYVKAINKKYGRVGSLFQKKFKRSAYDPEEKFLYLQYYIHHNARKHGIVIDFKDYPYHSYFEIMARNSKYIDIENLIHEFGSIGEFEKFHNSIQYEDKFGGIDLDGFI